MSVMDLPLFFDHLEEISVVDNTLKHRPQCQPIMTAECRREPKNRNRLCRRGGIKRCIWALYCRMEMRKNTTVPIPNMRTIQDTRSARLHTMALLRGGLHPQSLPLGVVDQTLRVYLAAVVSDMLRQSYELNPLSMLFF